MARTPEQIFARKRSLEGTDFERYGVAPALEADGYVCSRSHLSKGPFDWAGFKVGQIVVVGARITRLGHTNPGFSNAEIAELWRFASEYTRPGFEVIALVATAAHGPTMRRDGTLGPCRCSKLIADPPRFLRLTGPPVGRGQRANWEPWAPDYAAEVRGVPALAS